jgi:hypothetical protein
MGIEEVVGVLKFCHPNFNKNDSLKEGFRERVQTTVYLTIVAGVDSGYRHEWYGTPISSNLDEIIFQYKGNYHFEEASLTQSSKKKLKKLQKLLVPPIGIGQEKWSEILGTLHYFRNICGVKKGQKKTFSELHENRKNIYRKNSYRMFSFEEFRKAWIALDNVSLLDKKPESW